MLFSEPMLETDSFDVNVIYTWSKKTTSPLRLTKQKNNFVWSDNGKKLSFEIRLNPAEKISLQTNWWGCEQPLLSKKGIMLKVFSKVVLVKA